MPFRGDTCLVSDEQVSFSVTTPGGGKSIVIKNEKGCYLVPRVNCMEILIKDIDQTIEYNGGKCDVSDEKATLLISKGK